MGIQLKPLSWEAIPAALSRAERYRLLGEPLQAESICRDIIAVDAANQQALITLLLALTDQFGEGISMQETAQALEALSGAYERVYYNAIVHERRALALFRRGDFRSGAAVHSLMQEAMALYEQAEALRPPGNDDAVLRWNACARFLNRTPYLAPDRRAAEPALSSE
ncbi:MAG: hypothetical protein JST11_13115 [Acidobacteria bacterium]|nr:hypothetical protein [Acidobacteriota bacterium]